MSSADDLERKDDCLFPLSQLLHGGSQPRSEEQTFASFKPPSCAERAKLDAFLSSEEEDSVPEYSQQIEKKRLRDRSSTAFKEADAKRHKLDCEVECGEVARCASRKDEVDECFVDKKGDRNNLLYQGIYRMDIPSYGRVSLLKSADMHARLLSSGV